MAERQRIGRGGVARRSLIVAFVLAVLGLAGPARAATFAVTRLDDPSPSLGACIAVPDCSLREAVIAANSTFGPDTIGLPAGTYTLEISGSGEDLSETGDLDVADDLTLTGPGAVVDGGALDRVLDVVGAVTVAIDGLTIQNGSENRGDGGGGIRNAGTLTLSDVRVRDNNTSEFGAGIVNLGTLTVTNSSIHRNGDRFIEGGGIWNERGAILVLTDSVLRDNVATGGGGLSNFGTADLSGAIVTANAGGGIQSFGTLTVTNSTINANTPGFASEGGIDNRSDATLTNVTVSGNTASGNGGGISNTFGGLTITNSTISNNASTFGFGGGIANSFGATVTLTNVTISGNTAVSGSAIDNSFGVAVNLVNTIVDGDCSVAVTSLGHNLETGNTCGLTAAGDLVNTSPLLGPLQHNAPAPSFLETHALLVGSPAIDAGDNSACPATDERGVSRPQGAACDIGAYELEAAVVPTPKADLSLAKTDAPDPVKVGHDITYTLTVTNNGPDPATGITLRDDLPAGVALVSASPGCTGATMITCDLGTLSSGASATVAIVVLPPGAGMLVNSASVRAAEDDPTPGNNFASASTDVLPLQADLSVTKTASPDPVKVEHELTYTLTVANAGPDDATSVTLEDGLPFEVTLVSASPGCTGTVRVTCDLGTLAVGASATVTIVVRAPVAPGLLHNFAFASAAEDDPRPGDNGASTATRAEATADLVLTKAASPNPVVIDDPLTYTLTVTNNGPDPAAAVRLEDVLPLHPIRVVSLSPGCTFTSVLFPVVCDLGTLASGASATVAIVVSPGVWGKLRNTASVGSAADDPVPADNAAAVETVALGEFVADTLPVGGGRVSTDSELDGPQPLDPVETVLFTPTGGIVEIRETPVSRPAPLGFVLLGWAVAISAPPATVDHPMQITFILHSSLAPAGSGPLHVFKNGVDVPDCTPPPGVFPFPAVPDPCVILRTTTGVTVLTSTASSWDFGVRVDTTPPTTTAARAPDANAAGWNNADVTVTLTATDDSGGTGVKEITYSATGAQPIATTTVSGDSATIPIATEGETTIAFFAVDNAGNVEHEQTLAVKLDETDPEAIARFDPAGRDLAVFGRDDGSGVGPGPIAPTAVSREHNRELRSFLIVDRAGNRLLLLVRAKREGHELKAKVVSMTYGDGDAIAAPPNEHQFEWALAKDGSLKELEQELRVGKGPSKQELEAKFGAKKNQTTIKSKAPGTETKIVRAGLVLLQVATRRGDLLLSF